MKKLLLPLTITGALLLGACGNDESDKKDESKKSESVEKKKDTAKKSETKKDTDKKDNESTEQTEQASTEETNTQEQQSQEVAQQEQPTEQEQREANAEWNRQNVEGGTDAGMLDPSAQPDEYYSNDQLDPETGLPKDDAVPRKVGEEPTEEEIAEAEKDALREKYNGGLSSGEIQTKHAIEQGYYDGDNADEVMAEIEKSEQEIADGKYDHYKE